MICIDRKGNEITREAVYQKTLKRSEVIRFLGYRLVERWEHEGLRPWWNDRIPQKRTETYPHAIVYDFEAYQDKTKESNPTRDLSYESEHVPISVSIADTLNTEPEYICFKDPEEFIRLFYQSLVQRSALIRGDVEERYMPPDLEGLSKEQQNLIKQRCSQVPVVGFNSGRYDMQLIRTYFITHLGQENGVLSGEKQGRIMYINTPQFKFLDITNYLSPGITYDKWVKTYGAKQTKSWLPYEWFDSAEKLDYKGHPPYRSHKYDLARIVKRILGFDANSLYPSTMAKEMPCGKEFVEHYEDPVQAAKELIPRMDSKRWFGFAEVDIEVPQDLWEEFKEFPPIFITQSVGAEGISQHMKNYLAKSNRSAMPDQKKLLGVLKAEKVLLYTPLLKWYHEHGLEITAVHRTIDYIPRKIFSWFVQEVVNMRRKGDVEAEKALLAEVYKLLGNSAYGKFIEAVERQKKVLYTKDDDVVDKHLRSVWFEDLEEIGDAYKIESRKNKVTINRPFQVGSVVYQLAKLRMLQFYYDFLDHYLDRRDY